MSIMKNYYVLAINGSHRTVPRNTYYLLERILKPIQKNDNIKTEIINLSKKNIEYCKSCFTCNRDPCPINDDMPEIYTKMLKADAIIIGSPVYIYNVSGRVKTLFDRCRALLFRDENLKGKVGAAAAVGFVRNGGAELTVQAIRNFFDIHQMFYAGSVIGISGQQGGVTKDSTAKFFAKAVGKRILDLLNLVEKAKFSDDKEFIEKIHSKV